MTEEIPSDYRGWWRITETSQWVDDGLDVERAPSKDLDLP